VVKDARHDLAFLPVDLAAIGSYRLQDPRLHMRFTNADAVLNQTAELNGICELERPPALVGVFFLSCLSQRLDTRSASL
jgi:hypothetical protein